MKTLLRTLVISTLAITLTSSLAFAQDDTTTSGDGGLGGSTSTSTTTTTAVAITVGPIVTTTMVAGGGKSSAKMEAYLRNNATALQQDVRLGAGQTVADLAQIFQVSDQNQAAFGKIIRAHRAELASLAQVSKLNTTRTNAFVKTIFTAMQKDQRFNSAIDRLAKQG